MQEYLVVQVVYIMNTRLALNMLIAFLGNYTAYGGAIVICTIDQVVNIMMQNVSYTISY